MEQYLKELRNNSKIEKVNFKLNPSLEDEPSYNQINMIINTKRNLFEWAKSISLKPIDNQFEIKMTCPNNPNDTTLKDIYNKYKVKDWDGVCKSYSTNPIINLKGDKDLVNKLINYFYSILN